jgi:hypothetical protein
MCYTVDKETKPEEQSVQVTISACVYKTIPEYIPANTIITVQQSKSRDYTSSSAQKL